MVQQPAISGRRRLTGVGRGRRCIVFQQPEDGLASFGGGCRVIALIATSARPTARRFSPQHRPAGYSSTADCTADVDRASNSAHPQQYISREASTPAGCYRREVPLASETGNPGQMLRNVRLGNHRWCRCRVTFAQCRSCRPSKSRSSDRHMPEYEFTARAKPSPSVKPPPASAVPSAVSSLSVARRSTVGGIYWSTADSIAA